MATKIEHFGHEHDLKLIDEVMNNEICDGCVRAILPPFYGCAKCSVFLHKFCVDYQEKNDTRFINTHLHSYLKGTNSSLTQHINRIAVVLIMKDM